MSSAHPLNPWPDAAWRKERHVLECRDGELMTLVSLRTGRYHTLNQLGAFIWEQLGKPTELRDLVSAVHAAFETGDSDVTQDVAALLRELGSHGLACSVSGDFAAADDGPVRSAEIAPRLALSISSIGLALTRIRLLLRLGGVAQAARFAYGAPVSASTPLSSTLLSAVVERVNRVATLAPFRAECLERSLTVVRVLRRAGVDTKLRLAIRHYPFEAHAWAEHAGVAVNECRSVCALYTPFPPLEMEMLQCGR